MSVKVGGKMPGKDPENPDPDRNVHHAVVVLVSFTLNDFFHHYFAGTDAVTGLHFNWPMHSIGSGGAFSLHLGQHLTKRLDDEIGLIKLNPVSALGGDDMASPN